MNNFASNSKSRFDNDSGRDNAGFQMAINSSQTQNGNNFGKGGFMEAVKIQRASKSYGSGPKVLNNLSMTIEKGTM